MSIQLTAEQQDAIQQAFDHVMSGNNKKPFVIAGLAGTGKTVALVELVRMLKDAGMRPAVCAPTGKAANVISSKQDLFKASTIHGVLTENPIDHLEAIDEEIAAVRAVLNGEANSDALAKYGLTDAPKDTLNARLKTLRGMKDHYKTVSPLSFNPIDPDDFYELYKCLVIDEASMVGKYNIYDFLITPVGAPTVFFGDPGQLPPVQDKPAVNLSRPDVMFNEIHRQAQDSGIIKVAHRARHERKVVADDFDAFDDLEKIDQVTDEVVAEYSADHQVIVWMNKTRWKLNKIIRRARGIQDDNAKYPYLPVVGETMVLDQNLKQEGRMRGEQFTIISVNEEKYDQNYGSAPYLLTCEIQYENSTESHTKTLCITDLVPEQLMPTKDDDADERAFSERRGTKCMYPYAITAHKAQGSEWPKVLVIGEFPMQKDDFPNWFYTAATRAKEKLVVASNSYFRKKKVARPYHEVKAEMERKRRARAQA